MVRRIFCILILTIASYAQIGGAEALIGTRRALLGGASWVLPGASVDCYFSKQKYFGNCALTVTRAQTSAYVTNLTAYDPAGYSYQTFPANTPVIRGDLGLGVFEGRTNFLLNSTAPATQTTGSLANGTYTLWVNGSGSATMSAGTATGCGTAAASNGTPISFTTSGAAGTCIVTVAGSLNAFQLELNPGSVSAPTPFIITAGSTQARAADVITLTTPPTFGSAYSMFAQGAPRGSAAAQYLLTLNDGTANNLAAIERASGSNGNGTVAARNAGSTTSFSITTIADNTTAKIAASITN